VYTYNTITLYHRPALCAKVFSYIALCTHCIPITISPCTIGLQCMQRATATVALCMHCIPVTLLLSTIGLQCVQKDFSCIALYMHCILQYKVITKNHRLVKREKGLCTYMYLVISMHCIHITLKANTIDLHCVQKTKLTQCSFQNAFHALHIFHAHEIYSNCNFWVNFLHQWSQTSSLWAGKSELQ